MKLSKKVKIFISAIFIVDLECLIITLLMHFFRFSNLFISITFIIFILVINIILYCQLVSKKRKKEYYEDIYPCFMKTILKSKYSSLNSLSVLEEISYYILNIKNHGNISIKSSAPILYSILSFIFTTLIATITSYIAQITFVYTIQGMAILLLIVVSFFVFKKLHSIGFGKDHKQSIESIFLFCIEERRLEILNSSQKNILEKVKYALRLGEYH